MIWKLKSSRLSEKGKKKKEEKGRKRSEREREKEKEEKGSLSLILCNTPPHKRYKSNKHPFPIFNISYATEICNLILNDVGI